MEKHMNQKSNNSKKSKYSRRLAALSLCLLSLLFTGCASSQKEQGTTGQQTTEAAPNAPGQQETEAAPDAAGQQAEAFTPTVVEEDVDLPGYEGSCDLLFVADLHIVEKDDPDVAADQMETVNQRYTAFSNGYGASAEYWKKLAPVIDGLEADYVLFGGDMVDYCSESTVKHLKEGLDQIKTPWMYVRADHDLASWYAENGTPQEAWRLQDTAGPNEAVMTADVGEDLRIIGWNDSTSQMTAEAAEHMKQELQKARDEKKTVVLLTHIPLYTGMDEEMAELSRQAWQDRVLCWGANCYHWPDANTAAGLQEILAEESPVELVLTGHVHYDHEGMLTEKIRQYTFAPCYGDRVTLLHIH